MQHQRLRIPGPILILAAAVLWGTTGTSQALAPATASSLTIGAVRLVIGGSGLLILALLNGDLDAGRAKNGGEVRTALRSLGRPVILAGLAAAVCIAAYQIFFFAALRFTGVAIGTLITIGSAPLITGLLAFIQGRQSLDGRWLLATLLAICGCSLLLLPGQAIQVQPVGVALALGAGAAYALYTLSTESLISRYPPGAVAALTFCLGAVLLTPVLAFGELGWLISPAGLLVALHLGLLATALAYALFTRGLRLTPAPTAVSLSLAEPLTASLLGVFLLGERLPAIAFLGMGLIFAGLLILTIRGR